MRDLGNSTLNPTGCKRGFCVRRRRWQARGTMMDGMRPRSRFEFCFAEISLGRLDPIICSLTIPQPSIDLDAPLLRQFAKQRTYRGQVHLRTMHYVPSSRSPFSLWNRPLPIRRFIVLGGVNVVKMSGLYHLGFLDTTSPGVSFVQTCDGSLHTSHFSFISARNHGPIRRRGRLTQRNTAKQLA